MPSFKSVLTAVAIAVFAVGVNAEPSHQARSLAKAAAARRHVARGEYNGGVSVLKDTPESVAAGQIKCIRDSDCANAPTIVGSNAKCISGGCRLRCKTNYIPFGGTPPSQCIADDRSCVNVDDPTDKIKCPIVVDGWTRCNFHGTRCNIKCLKANRIQEKSDGSYVCLDIYHDADNCGGAGNVCPEDYNNLPGSAPRCLSRGCSLYCPTGTSPTPTGNSERPLACL